MFGFIRHMWRVLFDEPHVDHDWTYTWSGGQRHCRSCEQVEWYTGDPMEANPEEKFRWVPVGRSNHVSFDE